MIDRCFASAALLALLLGSHAGSAAGSAPDSTIRNVRGRARPLPQTPEPVTPPPPRGLRRFTLWLDSASLADSAVVMRLEARPRVGPDSARVATTGRDTRVVVANTVGREWIARFAKLVRAKSSFDPNGSCTPADHSPAHDDELILGVRFGAGDQAPSAVALLHEHCVELLEGAVAVGSADLEPATGYLVSLAREALPGDDVVRRLSESYPVAHRVVNIVVAPPSPEEAGKLGEYVYVEELPEAITKVPPQYPDEARKAGVDGTVLVQALVGKDGRVGDVRVQKSVPMLDAAAVASVYQWRFKPALAKGEPVAVWVAVPVRFTLH